MNILIVDDSVVFRMAIKQALDGLSGISVDASVSNGELAVKYIKDHPEIDLITLDMEMPVMNGMETIKAIREFNKKVMIIVFSSHTIKGAEKTLEALHLGANDFVTKEEASGATLDGSLAMIQENLLPKIEAFKKVNITAKGGETRTTPSPTINQPVSNESVIPQEIPQDVPKDTASQFVEMQIKPKIILIGSSTGGPEALRAVFNGINVKASVPMLLVQHMPAMFTAKLAEMLDASTPHVKVKEAEDGEVVKAGVCYIAPGDYHMEINEEQKIILHQGEKVCFVRPSVNVLFDSVAKHFKSQTMSIVMTGMGDDGAEGVKSLKEISNYSFIQNEESSIVWGMPGAVHRTGVTTHILDLKEIPELINRVFNRV